jgi:hypothetical protein
MQRGAHQSTANRVRCTTAGALGTNFALAAKNADVGQTILRQLYTAGLDFGRRAHKMQMLRALSLPAIPRFFGVHKLRFTPDCAG